MTGLILFFLLAIVVSFLCSLLEAVLLSLSHAHVAVLLREKRRCGTLLLQFKKKIDRPLAAILTLNTVANTLGAAGVGAQAQVVFGSAWVALFSGILTFCILVFSEIIPKTLGALYWKNLAPFAAYTINVLIHLTYPFVIGFEALGRLMAPKDPRVRVTREEVVEAAEMGQAEGELEDRERAVIRNLLHLRTITAREVMTPRSVMFALPKTDTVGHVIQAHGPMRFSRIPIYDRNMDDIVGLVRRYPINRAFSQGRTEQTLEEMSEPIHVVPASKSVADVLDELIRLREHIFLVVDEYGGTAGLITLEDAIETLLGVEIVDETDQVEDMRKFALEQWEKRKRKRMEMD